MPLKDSGNSAESPTDTEGHSVIDDAVQWLGLAAALEMLNS
jgi:hypothetical protein